MAYDSNYYNARKVKIQQRQNDNVQKLVNAAFEFVNGQADLKEQFEEISIREKESLELAKKKEEKKK